VVRQDRQVTSNGRCFAAAERIRDLIQALNIVHAGSDFGVLTRAVGVSVAEPEDGKSVEQCLAEASDLVMAAKRAGQRNRVHIHGKYNSRTAELPTN
jgi:PleD family two-component response regulator